jgi:anti-sigma regulatory factor (Ser/Thr protein kinase)
MLDKDRSLRTVLHLETMADAPVVRAVTLRRGLSAGLTKLRAGEVALMASELAMSIVKFGDGGQIVLDVDLATRTFWIVALDRGPGLPSLEDYFHGGSRAGFDSGVGAVRRLADDVRWERRDGGGSEISCRISLDAVGGPLGNSSERERTQ